VKGGSARVVGLGPKRFEGVRRAVSTFEILGVHLQVERRSVEAHVQMAAASRAGLANAEHRTGTRRRLRGGEIRLEQVGDHREPYGLVERVLTSLRRVRRLDDGLAQGLVRLGATLERLQQFLVRVDADDLTHRRGKAGIAVHRESMVPSGLGPELRGALADQHLTLHGAHALDVTRGIRQGVEVVRQGLFLAPAPDRIEREPSGPVVESCAQFAKPCGQRCVVHAVDAFGRIAAGIGPVAREAGEQRGPFPVAQQADLGVPFLYRQARARAGDEARWGTGDDHVCLAAVEGDDAAFARAGGKFGADVPQAFQRRCPDLLDRLVGARHPVQEGLHATVAELRPTPDQRPRHADAQHVSPPVETQVEHEGAPRLARTERDEILGQRARQHRRDGARRVVTRAALERGGEDRRAGGYVVRRIGEGVTHPVVAPLAIDVQGLIEIAGVGVVDRDEGQGEEVVECRVVEARPFAPGGGLCLGRRRVPGVDAERVEGAGDDLRRGEIRTVGGRRGHEGECSARYTRPVADPARS